MNQLIPSEEPGWKVTRSRRWRQASCYLLARDTDRHRFILRPYTKLSARMWQKPKYHPDYLEVWCVPSATPMSYTHRSQSRFSSLCSVHFLLENSSYFYNLVRKGNDPRNASVANRCLCLHDPDDRGNIPLRNIGSYLSVFAANIPEDLKLHQHRYRNHRLGQKRRITVYNTGATLVNFNSRKTIYMPSLKFPY